MWLEHFLLLKKDARCSPKSVGDSWTVLLTENQPDCLAEPLPTCLGSELVPRLLVGCMNEQVH